jgi:hypothetical protein
MRLCLCISSVYADSLLRHFGNAGIQPCGLTQHSQVSLYRSLHLFMPRKLILPRLLFSDLGARLLDQEQQFLYFNVPKLSFGHVRHIQRQVHIALFQLYPTSLRCHSSRHVVTAEVLY